MSRLLVICGISFAGKSALAAAIARRFGYAEVDVDVVKHRLFGPDCMDDELRQPDWERVYAEADRLIEQLLANGRAVVDASRNFRKHERLRAREIAARHAAGFVTVFVDTPVDIARQRLLENQRHPSRRDLGDEEFENIARHFEPPGPDEAPIILRPGDDVDQWLADFEQDLGCGPDAGSAP